MAWCHGVTVKPLHTTAVTVVSTNFQSDVKYEQPYPGELHPGSVYPTGDWYAPDVAAHGAAAYFGWSQTNSFLRYFGLVYNTVYVMGDPKHGLYNYQVPGATMPFYSCDLGLSLANSDYSTEYNLAGLADYLPWQGGMDQFWRGVRQGFNPPQRANEQAGPLAKAAKLESIAVDMVRVELSKGANLWRNVGSTSAPQFERWSDDATEYYIITTYYPSTSPLWFADKNASYPPDSGLVLHTFVVAIPSAAVLDGISPGFPHYGVHYGVGECSKVCGTAECLCDHILIDLRLEGNLGPAWTSPEFGLPIACIHINYTYICMIRF